MTNPLQVLYLVVCAAPPVLQISKLADLLMGDGWKVCVIATPTAAKWIDKDHLSGQTGHPVRSEWRLPGEPDVLPTADGVLVAPATFNTINKWALGISDNLALGILNEVLGLRLPILAFPCVKASLASHPSYARNIELLTKAGVQFEPIDLLRMDSLAGQMRWQTAIERMRRLRREPI